MFFKSRWLYAFSLASLLDGHAAKARLEHAPMYSVRHPFVPQPRDHAFLGNLVLRVDATDVPHQLFVVQERVPVGSLRSITLLYPRWEQASHGPSLTVTDLAGLVIRAHGRVVPWRRDAYEPHAFHVDVPRGATALDLEFEMVAGKDLLTPDIVTIRWQRLMMYPAGWYARNIPIQASLTLPRDLRVFTSLSVEQQQGSTYLFTRTSMEALLDSPVLAGRYASQTPLTESGPGAVSLDVIAPRASDLEVPADRTAELKRLVVQLRAVFGAVPFHNYQVLARLSDDGSSGGTEHRESSENALASSHFRDWPGQLLYRDLIAHEMVHAWNGFSRTPADLWAPTPNVPVAGSLLWMYEGQTEFWGRVLATRAGQFTTAELRDRIAIEAAEIAMRPGRAWRTLSDDVNYPAFMLRQPVPWRDWQRRRDYYSEGVMLWLAVDAELRDRSGGRYGMDEFAHRFFVGASPNAPTRTYRFEDLCRTLNDVAPGSWSSFLHGWVDAHDELDTTSGLVRHGWSLVFTDTPTPAFLASEEDLGVADLSYSIGLTVTKNGLVRSVAWGSPAFQAGMRPGVHITAVNAQPLSREALLAAVRSAVSRPVVLTVEQDGQTSDRKIHYSGTLRYPRLQRNANEDTLTSLLAPR